MANPKTIKEKIDSGQYELIDPLDYLLIGFLPDEGTLFAGLYPNGETVPNLRTKFTPEQRKVATSNMISARLRVMHLMKLVIPKERGVSAGGKQVWQRTAQGVAELKRWKGGQNGSTNVG